MLVDVKVPGSDDWLLFRLASKLGDGFERLKRLDSYRDGSFSVPVSAGEATREAYMAYAKRARLAFADTIVTQTAGRLNVRGFRTAVEGDQNGDAVAARIMRENHFGVQSRDLQEAKATYGVSFAVVGLDGAGVPFIAHRTPWQVAVQMDGVRPWLASAALIASFDEVAGRDVLTLLRPGSVRVAYRVVGERSEIPSDGSRWSPGLDWEWDGAAELLGFTDRVPVVPFPNANWLGEFERHLDSIDRVTEDILQRLTITAMQAFRQRAILPGEQGLPEFYPDDHPQFPGQRVDYNKVFENAPASLWALPLGAKVWESAPTSIDGLLDAEVKDLQHLAAVTATPLYSLSPDVNQSAEGAKLQRETVQTKVRDRQVRDNSAFAELMGLAFEAYGEFERADRSQIEPIWSPQEVVRRSDVAEAARAAFQAGKSQRFIDEHIFELSPEEMVQEEQNRLDQSFEQALINPVVSGV